MLLKQRVSSLSRATRRGVIVTLVFAIVMVLISLAAIMRIDALSREACWETLQESVGQMIASVEYHNEGHRGVTQENLTDLVEALSGGLFDGDAYVFIVDASTGDFLVNTRDPEVKNLSDLPNGVYASDMGNATLAADVTALQGGTTVLTDLATGEKDYFCYEPMNALDWVVGISVPEEYVFAEAVDTRRVLIIMLAFLVVCVGVYGGWLLVSVRRESRAKLERIDHASYVHSVQKMLLMAQRNADGTEGALQLVAREASAEMALFKVFAEKGVCEVYLWHGDPLMRARYAKEFQERRLFAGDYRDKAENASFVSLEEWKQSRPELYDNLNSLGISNLMGLLVHDENGELAGFLAVANYANDLDDDFENEESVQMALSDVALGFGMMHSNMVLFEQIRDMGEKDLLTGLKNRNSFEAELAQIRGVVLHDVACVYADADGLHALNNGYGHAAGDKMLVCISRALFWTFGADNVYRLGGDEFAVIIVGVDEATVQQKVDEARRSISEAGYSVSFGYEWRQLIDEDYGLDSLVEVAECRMRKSKNARSTGSYVEKNRILIIDGDPMCREELRNALIGDFLFSEADDGEKGLSIVENHYSELCAIMLGMSISKMNGLELMRILHERGVPELVPTFLIVDNDADDIVRECYALGAADVITKPLSEYVIERRVRSVVELHQARVLLGVKVSRQQKELEENAAFIGKLHRDTVETLAVAVEYHDVDSGGHIRRISQATKHLLANSEFGAQFTPEQIESISIAAVMHDVGKIAIPDSVLLKPGKLTPEEFETMKNHTVLGAELLEKLMMIQPDDIFKYAYDIALHHHERWDGTGYPEGLKGDEIEPWSQVVSIVDVYDALRSARPYKQALDAETACKMILNGECGAFNPKLLECFMLVEPEMRKWHNDSPDAASGSDLQKVVS